MKRITAIIANFFAGLGLFSLIAGWTLFLASSYDYTAPRDRFGHRTTDFLWVYLLVWAIPFGTFVAVRILRRHNSKVSPVPNHSAQPPRLAGG